MSSNGKSERIRMKYCSPEVLMSFLIGGSGRCSSEYGGVVITVLKPNEFPWEQVFRTLLNLNHEIYVEERDGLLTIVSKPKTD